MRVQLSPSLLNEYRVVYQGLYNKTSQDLVDYMVGDFEITDAVSRGKAYHKLLEYGPEQYLQEDGKYHIYERSLDKTWIFTEEAARPAIDLYLANPGLIHEVWTDYDLYLDGFEIKIRQRVDAIDGLIINEFKTTSRKPKYLDYRDSLQWRCNLLALPQAHKVKYTIFQIGARNNWTRPVTYSFGRDSDIYTELRTYVQGFLSWVMKQEDERLIKRIEMKEDRNPYKSI
jgi:hypothetical protein